MKDISKVLKKLEYGVYVVTMGKGTDGNAFTASWLSQVSSEPPMVAMAVHNKHQSMPKMSEAGAFAVNILAEGDDNIARTYFGPAESGYEKLKGAGISSSPETGSPLISGAVGYLDCKVVNKISVGNHTLFVAEVVAASLEREVHILTTFNSKTRYTG